MPIGYAQVSTQDQNLELQQKALIDTGCEKIFDDKSRVGDAQYFQFSKPK
jgi:DNA invertase Pin-like site-specific DNA recombinase